MHWDDELFDQASHLIDEARSVIAYHTNAVLIGVYWRLGNLVHVEILYRGRADYGEQIVATLSHKLTRRFGSGFDSTNLRGMAQFVRYCPQEMLNVFSSMLVGLTSRNSCA